MHNHKHRSENPAAPRAPSCRKPRGHPKVTRSTASRPELAPQGSPPAAARVGRKEAHGRTRGGASPGRMERADAGTRGANMPNSLLALQTQSRAEAARARVQEQDLRRWGLTGVHLRSYQLEGVNWLAQCFHGQNGCILGDEMGLGKTCQTIALLIYLSGRLNDEGPFLILCPLSVLSNWKEEMERFAPGLSCVTYTGHKEERAHLQQDLIQESRFHVLLTTYEVCLKDASFLKSFPWNVLVVDEAHRLKNQSSLLHKTLSEVNGHNSLSFCITPF